MVILGLLTGGILAGQSLIRAAELRSVSTSFANYRAAIYSFRDKYFALPGDMTNATSFWTSAGGTGANAACFAAQSTTTATCNGDGDGEIADAAGDGYIERFMAWKHLANAGMVEGSYTGKSAGAANTYVPTLGGNVPQGRISSTFYDLIYMIPQSYTFPATKLNRNTISIYGYSGTMGGAIAPEEAWNVDTKLDDGSPVTGSLFTFTRTSASGTAYCTTSDTNTSTYDFSIKANNCILLFGL